MTIGIVVATMEEFEALRRRVGQLGPGQAAFRRKGEFEIVEIEAHVDECHDVAIYVAHSHLGEISAAANTQLLISECGVDFIINYGVAGALVKNISVGEVFLVDQIFHYDFNLRDTDHQYPRGYYPSYKAQYHKPSSYLLNKADKAVPGLKRVTCLSSDSFIGPGRKPTFASESKAQICEMECAGVYLTCQKNGVKCLILKAISDAAAEGAEAFNENVESAAGACVDVLLAIVRYIVTEP